MVDLQRVVKLTQAQYNTLKAGGTVGSYTGLSANYIYFIQDKNQYIIDISNGITAAHKEAVEANPATLIQYGEYVYVPNYRDESIPSYYSCFAVDEYNAYWFNIDWEELDITDSSNYTIATTSDIPTVNNATLTITQNSTSIGTFTANAASNVTVNVVTPQVKRYI